LFEYLDGITLQEFVVRPEVQAIAQRQDLDQHRQLVSVPR